MLSRPRLDRSLLKISMFRPDYSRDTDVHAIKRGGLRARMGRDADDVSPQKSLAVSGRLVASGQELAPSSTAESANVARLLRGDLFEPHAPANMSPKLRRARDAASPTSTMFQRRDQEFGREDLPDI